MNVHIVTYYRIQLDPDFKWFFSLFSILTHVLYLFHALSSVFLLPISQQNITNIKLNWNRIVNRKLLLCIVFLIRTFFFEG